ncbi:Fur-regulated basic protein FbpA [Salibacterium halotolerans]|uniref:Fur-regulated basic protein A n=1 Tax=Salibacterium halotolerans TaxID=1884432 RepID=A0A1I5N7N2_9BACI|nr:Fur-regulated basic protein FbpA [Salibacterium halotolerans]SFP17859.1 Fur-regulated basic protein A [Salibacterium halotolerans]
MAELRRQVIIKELEQQGFFLALDGRLLNELTVSELEREKVRLPELMEVEQA